MTTNPFDMATFVGRFQPFHNGHLSVIEQALAQAKHVTVLVGSANKPRDIRDPFTFEERKEMILGAVSDPNRVHLYQLPDILYNDAQWVVNVQETVKQAMTDSFGAWWPLARIALIGHGKDNSSFYLKLFPQWDAIDVQNHAGMNATDIRAAYFTRAGYEPKALVPFADRLPASTIKLMEEFAKTPEYENIVGEYEFVQNYKKSWEAAPYAPTFVTVDACIVQSGHVLLVQRKARPGKGLWALPGGFIAQDERIEDAVLRELREETKIKVPTPVLKGNIVTSKVFDHPFRSSRGRTITHAFLIHLPGDTSLPKVKGADDADKAKWVPLSEVTADMMYEDHYSIIQNLTAEI